MKIYIGSDHAGFEYKQHIISYLSNRYELEDCGTYSEESVNYTDYAHLVCKGVLQDNGVGILICGSGIGMSIYANRFKGIRAGLCTSEYQSLVTRKHNNANVLCIGSRISGIAIVYSMVDIFLKTEYEAGRHEERVQSLDRERE